RSASHPNSAAREIFPENAAGARLAHLMKGTMRTKQAPIPSGHGPRTTARELLRGRRLDGAIAVVTGGYVGIGREARRALVEAGATGGGGARPLDKARAALAGMPRVEIAALDLADRASVDVFAAVYLASRRPIHMLINNAGIMATPLVRDSRRFE